MITIAITGGYNTGKTMIAKMFGVLGADVLYADRIAHMVMRPHTSVWDSIVKCFGKDILQKDDEIDRCKLAKIVFSDKRKLNKLNRIVHPVVIDKLKKNIRNRFIRKRTDILAVEIPLLFEVGLELWFTKVIVVMCRRDVQYERANARDKISKLEFLKRIRNQWPISKKIEKADFVIDNSGTMDETREQVIRVYDELKSNLSSFSKEER